VSGILSLLFLLSLSCGVQDGSPGVILLNSSDFAAGPVSISQGSHVVISSGKICQVQKITSNVFIHFLTRGSSSAPGFRS
jgi:hypothetical protein